MLASISEGTTRIKNLLLGDDCLRTIEAFQAMGVPLTLTLSPKGRGKGEGGCSCDAVVRGVGMRGLKRPGRPVYLGNSGTTMRILPGILAGQDFQVVLKGDKSLSARPMMRVARPLRRMGAKISGRGKREIFPPLKIRGSARPRPIKYKSKAASAQVKSCIMLAGLFAKGTTSVSEPVKSRDHTERMLEMLGCKVRTQGRRVSLKGPVKLKSPGTVTIPGDISSAAFFIVAGCILSGAKIIIKNVGLNPTRTGIIDILKRMEADVSVKCKVKSEKYGEPSGDIVVKSSRLRGVTISPQEVVRAIDEIPVIMVAACLAKGATVIKGIGELRIKETDRVRSMVTNLRRLGAEIEVKSNELRVKGGRVLRGARVSSYGDHRTAMSMLIAGLVTKGKVIVTGLDCINKSFPNFHRILRPFKLTKT